MTISIISSGRRSACTIAPEMCSSFVDEPQFMEWYGSEMFRGRKPQ